MNTYAIANWSSHFETYETKRLKSLHWVPIPNKHDGKGYKRIMRMKDGPMIYAAWLLLVQVASKCPQRGLLEDQDGPLSADDLELKTEMPKLYFEQCFKPLCDVGWLKIHAESAGTTGDHAGTTGDPAAEGRKEGRNGTEGKEGKVSASPLDIVNNLNFGDLKSEEFKSMMIRWVELRMKGKKVKTDWTEFFQGQIELMQKWGYQTALNSISLAVTNQWDGIHEKQVSKPYTPKPSQGGNF